MPVYDQPSMRDLPQTANTNQTQPTDPCGPEPPKPNYYSPQSERDKYNQWEMCKDGVG